MSEASFSRRPTMKEVAAVAGVSIATVSRVVNGGPSVHPELAEKVQRAVDLLGYRHNVTASSLRRGMSASIGLIFDDVANPFFAAIHGGVEEVARARGVLTFAGSSDEAPARERELAQAFGARGVDGLLIVPAVGGDHGYLQRDAAAGVALVFVDRPPRFLDADVVLSDNAGGASLAVDHLVAHGHTRIAYLGDRSEEIFTAAERLRGFRESLVRHGLTDAWSRLVAPGETAPALEALLRSSPPPTALISGQNLVTVAALHALHAAGLQERLAHVGFDDVLLADVVKPGLTVIAQDPDGLGRRAAELLFERLDGYTGPARRVVLDTTLIARGSGELTAR
jgi:LacI family transcriptional regulator, galactose operon repressor